ncbi:hypothetical protein HCH_04324 [Hahella chejuensis KCTC 2396]|uniref:Uncharacterized protein n=1 Tax=Hahella chejuensis (strain KCTC 2396) TaxID=349521 RepID=Q2SE94_HAHCH|nr:hypothetical protein [Hahella chejuensis]ABC31030.1 hypothetical protein HCH_04324 [Hahella chejuensis KCTC 2396]
MGLHLQGYKYAAGVSHTSLLLSPLALALSVGLGNGLFCYLIDDAIGRDFTYYHLFRLGPSLLLSLAIIIWIARFQTVSGKGALEISGKVFLGWATALFMGETSTEVSVMLKWAGIAVGALIGCGCVYWALHPYLKHIPPMQESLIKLTSITLLGVACVMLLFEVMENDALQNWPPLMRRLLGNTILFTPWTYFVLICAGGWLVKAGGNSQRR